MNDRSLKFWVGVMVVSTVLSTGILILWLGNEPAMFRPTYTLCIDFEDAPSIMQNTPIRKSGILIGRVNSVELLRAGGVRLTVGIHKDVDLPANVQCRVYQNAFLGDAEVEFFLPPGEAAAEASLAPDSVLKGVKSPDALTAVTNLEKRLSGAIGTVSEASDKLGATLGKVNGMIDNNREHIDSIIKQMDETLKLVHNSSEFTNDLLSNTDFRKNLKTEVEQLPQTLADTRATIADLRTTMQRVTKAMDQVEDNIHNVTKFTTSLGEDGPSILQAMDRSAGRLDTVLGELEGFSKSINSRDGSLGKLVKDDEMYERLNQTIRNVEEITYRLKPIINDARIISDKLARHPGSIIREAVRPGAGTKGLPPGNWDPGNQGNQPLNPLR
jgi:phospholipid/cholesterol/gamma-HCH transport system substrate-binding protein